MRRATGAIRAALNSSNHGAAITRAAALGVVGGQQLRALQGSSGSSGPQAPQASPLHILNNKGCVENAAICALRRYRHSGNDLL